MLSVTNYFDVIRDTLDDSCTLALE